jgi:hypothetical protein
MLSSTCHCIPFYTVGLFSRKALYRVQPRTSSQRRLTSEEETVRRMTATMWTSYTVLILSYPLNSFLTLFQWRAGTLHHKGPPCLYNLLSARAVKGWSNIDTALVHMVTRLCKQLDWKDTLHFLIQTHSSCIRLHVLCSLWRSFPSESNICDLTAPSLKFVFSNIHRFSSYLAENTCHYKRQLENAVLIFWESTEDMNRLRRNMQAKYEIRSV